MPPLHSSQALLKELQEHNGFFDELVDMIPAKLYIKGNSGTWTSFSFWETR